MFAYINYLMSQLQKYRKLSESLKENKEQGREQNEAEFYFRQLERLQIDLLVGQIEVAEQKRQISVLEAKIETIRQEQRQINLDNHKQNECSSEQQVREFVCPLKECGKHFQKQSGQRLHSLLVHNSATKWKEGMIFKLSLEQQP